MTSFSMARQLVYAHFLGSDGYQAHDVFEDFDPKRLDEGGRLHFGGEKGQEVRDIWVSVVVRHTDRIQETLGPPGQRRFQNHATIFCRVFVPLATVGGPQYQADLFADALIAMWSSKRIVNADNSSEFVKTYASIPRDEAPGVSYLTIMVETAMTYDERA